MDISLQFTRMAKMKTKPKQIWRAQRRICSNWNSYYWGWVGVGKLVQPLWKTTWQYLPKLNIYIYRSISISQKFLSQVFPNRKIYICSPKDMYKNVQSNNIQNSPKYMFIHKSETVYIVSYFTFFTYIVSIFPNHYVFICFSMVI